MPTIDHIIEGAGAEVFSENGKSRSAIQNEDGRENLSDSGFCGC